MRKLSLIFSILEVVAMMLTACGGEQTNTPAPQVTLDTTVTSEVPESTETVMVPDDTTTTPGVPVTGGENPSRVTTQLDLDVWNENGEQVGEVDDMILDLDNSRVAYVVVGTGGFLDIGEKDVLVPWASLQLQTEPGDATGGQLAFVLQGDPELLKNSPDVDIVSILPAMGEPAGDWDIDIRNFWETGVVPATQPANETTVPEMTATTDPNSGSGTGQGQVVELQGVVLASDVLGSSIMIGQSQGVGQGLDQATAVVPTLGSETAVPGAATATPDLSGTGNVGSDDVSATIEDMIIDTDTGDIQYLVLDTSFTDGERWIPVPLGFLQWDATNQSFIVKVNANALQNAPFFEEDQFPDTSADGWDVDFSDFWNNQ